MMMISSNRRRKGNAARIFTVAVVVALLLLALAIWRTGAEALFWSLTEPIIAMRNTLERSEADKLRSELAQVNAELADRNLLYQENVELKMQLGRRLERSTILAAVLQGPPGVPYDTLLIDAGEKEGVAKGDLVSAGGTTVLGEVFEVYPSTARVQLFSASGMSHQGQINGTVPISVEGQGGGSMRGEVPAEIPLTIGDPVVLPGIAGGFASRISYIERKEGSSFQTVYLQLSVNIFELRFVTILKEIKND